MALSKPETGVNIAVSGDGEPPLYRNREDRQLHLKAVASLALKLEKPAVEVERLYSLVLKRLWKDAKVTAFLPLLTSRRVEELFEKYPNIGRRGL